MPKVPGRKWIGRQSRRSQQMQDRRDNESQEDRERRLSQRRQHQQQEQERQAVPMLRMGLRYDPNVDISPNNVGLMNQQCRWCNALKFNGESEGFCCQKGKVRLAPIHQPPDCLRSLLNGDHPLSDEFFKNIRAYNNSFQMTSFKANQVREAGFMPTFKVQGQIYHIVGSVLPPVNTAPKFLQVYFIADMDEQVNARVRDYPLNADIIRMLQQCLHSNNPFIRDLKTALESAPRDTPNVRLVIHADRRPAGEHPRRFNAPQTSEVAVLMVGQDFDKRDIVLQTRSNQTQIINDFHRSYDALQYPLMFIYGDDGYSLNIPLIVPDNQPSNKKVSCMSYYAYRMMVRRDAADNTIFHFRSLLNQYWVDMYVKMETERLNFIRQNQTKLRAETYIHLRDALQADQPEDVQNIGQRIILPSTFTGSPRYMHERTQDALTYVRHHGRPDLFITFTCNPKWEEIQSHLLPGQTASDRYDIVSRVFHLKVKALLKMLTQDRLFGNVQCFMYTVEWQKRGLPHIHLLLWLCHKLTPDQINLAISAEIPDEQVDPNLHALVKKHMMHGPCGDKNPNSPCMVEGRCSKHFPKPYQAETTLNNDGYARYKRPQNQRTIEVRGVTLDNAFVVPYNATLLKSLNAHINVEYCTDVKSIKYVCKYINKGSDQATFSIQADDEIKQYVTGRYVSSSEAVWRILSFDIHERSPTIQHLAVHLENGQRVYFTNDHNAQAQIENPKDSTLTAFFKLCAEDNFAQTITYDQVPTYYTWNAQNHQWTRRKRGSFVEGWPGVRKSDALARVYTIHPNNVECFHLRILLHHVAGPTSFQYIRTVEGVPCDTFQMACKRLGLLQDDQQWQRTLEEAAIQKTPSAMRFLFATLLIFCQVADPEQLWTLYRNDLAQDILHRLRTAHRDNTIQYSDQIYHAALLEINGHIKRITPGKTLRDFHLPEPEDQTILPAPPLDLTPLLEDLSTFEVVHRDELSLNVEQKEVYLQIIQSVVAHEGKLYFLDAPGGTGKTFLLNLLISKVKCLNLNVIAVASSGIASTLLQNGKTAHSAFKIPLKIIANDDSPVVCNISKQSDIGKALQECHLCLWDEATMANKVAIEAVDRTLRDLRNCPETPMGGVTFLFAGDFRQTLPVVPRGTRPDEVNACLKNSYLWQHMHVLHLTTNMRVQLSNDPQMAQFASLLLQLGNGQLPQHQGMISIENPNFCRTTPDLTTLINTIYPNIDEIHQKPLEWFAERAILAARNKHVDEINQQLMDCFNARQQTYYSVNTTVNPEDSVLYPPELLNSLDLPGLPLHKLTLKENTPVILLRNLNPPKLCNGTRLLIKKLHSYFLEAIIITGCGKGQTVFIPRIPMVPSDSVIDFKRLQFPVKVCFAMTVNKAQGQTLKLVGVSLKEQVFSHGQLYVACSRVSTNAQLYLYEPTKKAVNVVYPEALI